MIIDLYSKRQKRLRGEPPEIYSYDEIPQQLRVQIVHIIEDVIGTDKVGRYERRFEQAYEDIHKFLCREYGVFTLGSKNDSNKSSLLNQLLYTKDIEKVIDVIELTFKYIDRVINKDYLHYTYETDVIISPEDAIQELNDRFKEHGIGYQFESGEIMRVDSKFTHSEIVKPTIALLCHIKFQGANEEYLKAHEHYRHGRNKECLTECLKAFESVMKIICNEKSWQFDEKDTSRKLIQICFKNNLIPTFTQNQFTSLQNLLESGIPSIRNKLGGHGQGQIPLKVDNGITRYALNLTGSNIIFLIEQSEII